MKVWKYIQQKMEESRPFSISEDMMIIQLTRCYFDSETIAMLLCRAGTTDQRFNILSKDDQTWRKLHPVKCFCLRYVLARLRNLLRPSFWIGVVMLGYIKLTGADR